MRVAAVAAAALLLISQSSAPVTAGSGDRTLWLYHTHTHETAKFTFKRNGQYDQAVLQQMNTFLADWRTHNPTHMDPHLFDLLWEVYQDVGGKQPYNIVSSYREPATNAMLRARSAKSGVAENSQHMLGKAMDVFIPGVPLATLRAAAMRHQVGGVGFYPTSGSPFVHMDTGNVRAWPRMTRAQLKTVFPDGKTLHLPVDGTPLSSTGRQYAQAQWSKCHMVPCTADGMLPGAAPADDGIRVASLDPSERTVSTIDIVAPSPMAMPIARLATVDTSLSTPALAAPEPLAPPSPLGGVAVEAKDGTMLPAPFSKSIAVMVATRDTVDGDGQTALSVLNTIDPPVPAPRVLMTPKDNVLTAYAPEIAPDPGAQRALQMLIERQTTASLAPAPVHAALPEARVITASLGGTNGLHAMNGIFDLTWQAMTDAAGATAIANTLTNAAIDPDPVVGLRAREIDLIAPEIDHVNETLTTPLPMTNGHYADMYQPEGYLDNAAELGPMANRIALESDMVPPPRYDTFVVHRPMLVASRS